MPHILIADDDARFRRTLHLALAAHGYEVSDAADGKEVLEAVAVSAPDLVVLDWHMPQMDGIQTCRILGRVISDVPVILVSGNRANSKDVALAAGANDYLPKPFSIDELLRCIETVLKHRGREAGGLT